jgi:predicted nucleic acid-binding protein
MHLNENTYLLMTNVIAELVAMVRAKQANPEPLTHDQHVALRKADEVRQVALSEARLAGILPPAAPGARS